MEQSDLFETADARALLDQLFEDSRLYHSSQDYLDLLNFVVRMRNFAPFNAMLLQIQKPGLRFAASAKDWRERFGREKCEKARPLLILWPFGPVGLVYDVMDTTGAVLPEDVSAFPASGPITSAQIAEIAEQLTHAGIECLSHDAGDQRAGSIRVIQRAASAGDMARYRTYYNKNHAPPVQFATIAHELGHLFLGHLGPDTKRSIRTRARPEHAQRELEAESVSYIVCCRNGVESKSQTYLANYVKSHTTIESLDFYQVMRAAGQVESLMGLATHTRFDGSSRVRRSARPKVRPDDRDLQTLGTR